MSENNQIKKGPLVSVLVPTFNRPVYLSEAIRSVLRQNYIRLQIIVINDGGVDVSGLVNSFNDPRIMYINRKENRGKAFSLNQALAESKGKYIAYLDDDDLFYPNHISTLVETLEKESECGVAYSDLYKTYCRVMPDGKRETLSKLVEVSRDFDRFFMLYFNHVLHVSLMHRKDLIEKTGPYNENLNVLIDWDMTRRLVFFSDFYHIPKITGEFYAPVGESDRISVQQRKDKANYARNVLAIRTTRPAKPWAKLKDLSIIFTTERFDQQAGQTIGLIWRHTFYPYKLYLPIPSAEINRIKTDMPNLVYVPVKYGADTGKQVDAALGQCEGQFIAIVPSGFPVREMWLEDSFYGLINSSNDKEGLELEGSTEQVSAIVAKKQEIEAARRSFPQLKPAESLKAAGISIRKLRPDEVPFQFDSLLKEAKIAGRNGDWLEAAEIYQHIAGHYDNQMWMEELAAKAFWKAGLYSKAYEISSGINNCRPSIDTLLLEAKVRKEQKDFYSAIELLEQAEEILEGNTLVWT